MKLAIRAATLLTAAGSSPAAVLAALCEGRCFLTPADMFGLRHGHVGRVSGVEAHELPPDLAAFDCRNHRLAAMALGAPGFAAAVAAAAARHGAGRIAVVVGTSTAGVLSTEEAYRDRPRPEAPLPTRPEAPLPAWFDYRHTLDLGALAEFVRRRLGLAGPAFTVSTACTSSARAVIDAHHLLAAGLADAAVVGGADSLCRMTLAGFASLGLVSAAPCRPFDAARDGISVAEAAGFVLLERPEAASPADLLLLGTGAAAEAHHMSAPRPDGAGAALALTRALAAAGLAPAAIDAVCTHGTGTRANDAAEDAALARVFGPGIPATSLKGGIGHAMGSSGIVSLILSAAMIGAGRLPPAIGLHHPDPGFTAAYLRQAARRPLARMAINALGFGGANAALVIGRA